MMMEIPPYHVRFNKGNLLNMSLTWRRGSIKLKRWKQCMDCTEPARKGLKPTSPHQVMEGPDSNEVGRGVLLVLFRQSFYEYWLWVGLLYFPPPFHFLPARSVESIRTVRSFISVPGGKTDRDMEMFKGWMENTIMSIMSIVRFCCLNKTRIVPLILEKEMTAYSITGQIKNTSLKANEVICSNVVEKSILHICTGF